MYAEHFGLNTPVFTDGISQDERVFRGQHQKSLQASLVVALTRSDSVAVLCGPPGTGKTTLAASTLRESATKLALGCLAYGPLTRHELLEQLLTEYGFTPYRNSRTERLAIWRQHLAEMSATGTRVCVLVENADQLGVEVLAELESLTAADPRGGVGANVVLMARSNLEALDAAPELEPLRQRVRLIARLMPLDLSETEDYLNFRLEQAGGNWADVADGDAAACLHRYSGGIIRILDNLTESCLGLAAVREEPRISQGLVMEIAENLQLAPADGAPYDDVETADTSPNESLNAAQFQSGDESPCPVIDKPERGAGDPVEDEKGAGGSELPGIDREHAADLFRSDAVIPAEQPFAEHDGEPDASDEADEATAEAGIVILVGGAPQSASDQTATSLSRHDLDMDIPVLDDVVETGTISAESIATEADIDLGQKDETSGSGSVEPAGDDLAEEDREQIALLEAFTQTELRELDGLEELVSISATLDAETEAAAIAAKAALAENQPDDEDEQESAEQPSRWFA